MDDKVKKFEDYKLKPFTSVNKLHLVLGGEASSVIALKEIFIQQLNGTVAVEKEICTTNKNVQQRMTESNYNFVCDLLNQCKDMYEIEALAALVFDQNRLPDSYEEVQNKAIKLKLQFPVFDILLNQKKYYR